MARRKKGGPAFTSGMRGSEKPTMEPEEAEERASGAEHGEEESAEEPDFGDLDVNEHVHGPDEKGHMHLNLSTLARAVHKRGGLHDE